MITIVRPRCKGKTTLLVDMVKRDAIGGLVCATYAQERMVRQQFQLPEDKVVSWHRLPEFVAGRRVNLYFDNIDCVLQGMFPNASVMALSATEGRLARELKEEIVGEIADEPMMVATGEDESRAS